MIARVVELADWETLKSLSLVCKDFEHEAGRHLWRVLSIHTLGQGYEEARDHVDVKIRMIRKRVQHIREVSLGVYSGYCTFWRSEQDTHLVLIELFSLLSQLSLTVLSINLDAYGPAVAPCLHKFKLPPTLTHLTISNGILPNLGYLRPCLHSLESLKLRSVSHGSNCDFSQLESLPAGTILSELRHLEVDRANQLLSLQHCVLPALESLSVVVLCRDGVEVLCDYLSSLSPMSETGLYHRPHYLHPAPSLRNLSLRLSYKPDVRPTPSLLYGGLLLHPFIRSSRVLSNLQKLTVVHDAFPTQYVQDETLFDLVSTYKHLQYLNWDLLMETTFHQERVVLAESILKAAFRRHETTGRTAMREISTRVMMWRILPSQKFWVRRYVSTDDAMHLGQDWHMIDETRTQ